MGHCLFLRKGEVHTAPVVYTPLGNLAEGSIVKLNENGSPVEFYVAKHDYESGLNGAGRTLLVRKDCYGYCKWNSSDVNTYASSTIDTWLNDTYEGFLDADIRDAIGATEFYYTPGNGSTNKTTLTRSIFQLSLKELGETATYANAEGTALPIASKLQIAYRNGSAIEQWTRTPHKSNPEIVYYFSDKGSASSTNGSVANSYGSRPAFTLPSTAKVDDNGVIKV